MNPKKAKDSGKLQMPGLPPGRSRGRARGGLLPWQTEDDPFDHSSQSWGPARMLDDYLDSPSCMLSQLSLNRNVSEGNSGKSEGCEPHEIQKSENMKARTYPLAAETPNKARFEKDGSVDGQVLEKEENPLVKNEPFVSKPPTKFPRSIGHCSPELGREN